MDPRYTAQRTSVPPAGDETDDDWMIGVSDSPPWELASVSERPPTLPAAQPAPWAAGRQDAAPWTSAQPAPFARSADYEPAPWDARPSVAAPWDRPDPFSVDDEVDPYDDVDPYDAAAPVVADAVEQPRPRMPAVEAVDVMVEPRPAEPVIQADDAEDSWFVDPEPASDASAWQSDEGRDEAVDGAEPAIAKQAEAEPAPDPLEWPPVPTDVQLEARPEAAAAPADPVEWPPIPTDMFAIPGNRAAERPIQAPVATSLWAMPEVADEVATESSALPPTTPADAEDGFASWALAERSAYQESPAVAQAPAVAEAPAVEAQAVPDAPAAAQGAYFAEPAAPAHSAGQPFAPVEDDGVDEFDDWAFTEVVADEPEPATPVAAAAPAAAEPPEVVEDDAWMLGSTDPEPLAAPPAPPAPAQPPAAALAADEPGAVFARYVTGTTAAESPTAAASETLAPSTQPASGGGDDLWFLANEPKPSSSEAADAAEPTSMQTAIATVLVAALVIGLVIVFLLLFTSVFR